MSGRLLDSDQARRLPRFRELASLRGRQEQLLRAEASRLEAAGTVPLADNAPPRYAGGDPLSLRGIPAIGRSVSGAIPGTAPGTLR